MKSNDVITSKYEKKKENIEKRKINHEATKMEIKFKGNGINIKKKKKKGK